jgi:hypothetical protein
MLKRLLRHHGIWRTTFILSGGCVITSIAITLAIGTLTHQPDIRFTLAMAFLCPAIIAPVVIYSYSKLSKALDQNRRVLKKLNLELETALDEIKELSGLLPICAACKKIRDDQGYWQQIEYYVSEHAQVQFSHGICPDCAAALYPDFTIYDDTEDDQ